jgi:hypothetical protein
MDSQIPKYAGRLKQRAWFKATFKDGSTAVYYGYLLCDCLQSAGETRQPTRVTVTDLGQVYSMTQAGILRAMQNSQASEK